jgi:ubiquinone/menaquinone biosynthesis C-methylase UbiE
MNTKSSQWRKSSSVFHERANEYDSWFEDSLLFDIEATAIKALAVPITSPALEIGVGPGRFAHALGSDFGIDPANAPLHLAANREINVCQAVGEFLPFTSNSFTKVSIFFTLCFVQNPAWVLDECHRVLQKEGHLILGFVPATSPWGKALLKKKKTGHPFYEYAHFFSVEECETLIRDSGFSIISSSSSLYQNPGEVKTMEEPTAERDKNAGFIALSMQKN